jgi:hypothetical protein
MIPTVLSSHIADSYSRELDMRVQASELPYGYEGDGPAADTGDLDLKAKEK